jgi:hypothetical protein
MKNKLHFLYLAMLFVSFNAFALPTLIYSNTTVTYGDNNIKIRPTAQSPNSTYTLQNIPVALTGLISINVNSAEITVLSTALAGIYTITARATDVTGFSDASFTLTINKAPLTVTGQNKTITYCSLFPTCAASFTGFKNAENSGVLTGTLICDYGVTAPAPAGNYVTDLSTSTLSSPNYAITYVNGSLIVSQSPVTVAITQASQSILIGQSNTFTATVTGNVNCVPIGTIIFTIDGVAQLPVTLDNLGVAIFTANSLAIGTHSVFATYSGSVNHLGGFSLTLSNTVCPLITIGNIANGTMNLAYNQTINVSPADAYVFSVPIGQLPRGLTLNSTTGQITGTPLEAGIFSITIAATNGITCSKSKSITLKIAGNNCSSRHFDASASSPISTGSVPNIVSAGFPPAAGDYHLATADFNNDGILDLILPSKNVSNTASFSLYLGNGSGGFTGGTPIPTRTSLGNNIAIVTADFDNDGDKDVVMGEADSPLGEMIILVNDGLGNFTISTTTFNTIRLPTGAAAGDFNQDGKPDIAMSMANSNRVQIFLNTSIGGVISFSNLVSVNTSNLGLLPRAVVVGNFNADNFLDIATANYTSGSVSVAFGDGTGAFTIATVYPTGVNCRDIATGDLDNDGDFDLVTANYGESSISILTNNGSGTFGVTSKIVATKMNGVAINDFNGDGFYDILASSQTIIAPANTQSYAYLLYNNGSGSFATPTTLGIDYFAVGLQPGSTIAGDFNQDGSQDFISANIGANNNTGSLSVYLNNCPPVANNFTLNHGSGVAANEAILTVFDGNQVANTLIPRINGGMTATLNGVTISNLSVNANGNVMADVAATCGATNTTFSISVTDIFNKTATATLTINIISGPNITTEPTNKATCDATSITIPIVVTGLGLTYQWKISIDGGATYNNVLNNSTYSGATTDALNILASSAISGYKYKCAITGACSNIETNVATLSVQTAPVTLSGNVAGGTNQLYNSTQISSTQTLSATSRIEYRAGKSIVLSSGFLANNQSVFQANIIGCN